MRIRCHGYGLPVVLDRRRGPSQVCVTTAPHGRSDARTTSGSARTRKRGVHEHGSAPRLHPPATTGSAPPVHTAGPRRVDHDTGRHDIEHRDAGNPAAAAVAGARVRQRGTRGVRDRPGHVSVRLGCARLGPSGRLKPGGWPLGSPAPPGSHALGRERSDHATPPSAATGGGCARPTQHSASPVLGAVPDSGHDPGRTPPGCGRRPEHPGEQPEFRRSGRAHTLPCARPRPGGRSGRPFARIPADSRAEPRTWFGCGGGRDSPARLRRGRWRRPAPRRTPALLRLPAHGGPEPRHPGHPAAPGRLRSLPGLPTGVLDPFPERSADGSDPFPGRPALGVGPFPGRSAGGSSPGRRACLGDCSFPRHPAPRARRRTAYGCRPAFGCRTVPGRPDRRLGPAPRRPPAPALRSGRLARRRHATSDLRPFQRRPFHPSLRLHPRRHDPPPGRTAPDTGAP